MTVVELVAFLRKFPSDTELARSCGGDCIGYTQLRNPVVELLFENPEGERVYEGELFSESDYQTHMRCKESNDGQIDVQKEWPLPEGKKYLVF